MNNILVTGGAGFIGSHLCSYLVNKGYQVFCLDNFSTGNKKNINSLMKYKNFNIIEHNIIKSIKLHVDVIFNLACPASPVQYQKNPIKTMKTSIYGMYNVIDIALKNNAYLIHASTSEIYGDPLEHPQNESYWGNVNPIGLRSCYDEGKRCCESILMDYARNKDLKATIVRIFNTFGPNMTFDDGRVISNFIVNAIKNNDIIIYGNGKQTRSFCFIDDLITAFDLMMMHQYYGPINIGNDFEISILDLSRKITQMLKTKSNIIHKSLPDDDPIRRKPDITLAKKILNWQPQIKLDIGLELTIEYFKRELL